MKFSINTSLPVIFEQLEQLNDSRFLRAKVWVCHTGENLNGSYFSKEVIANAIPSLANIPVLGFIQVDNTNHADFRGHEQRLVVDKDGARIEYLGRMYGIVPETNNAKFETKLCDDGVEREFLTVEVLLHTKFKECIDIIQRDGIKNHSMELLPESIKGQFNKDGLFEFTEFKFEGLCILGDDVTPAMRGSVLELFSQYNYQNEYIDLLREFNQVYSQLNKNSCEGGSTLKENKKQQLFEKFSNLTEEDVKELKESIDKYSYEELEAKLKKLADEKEKKHKNEDQSKQSFSFTAKQLEQELRTQLSKEKVTDQWGDAVRAYWYIDHDENRVYAEDVQNNYLPVGINYYLNGDQVSIDFATKKRIKWVPKDLEEGSVESPTLMSIERNQYEIDKVKSDFSSYQAEMEEKLSTKENELQQLKDKYTSLEQQYTKVNEAYVAKLKAEREAAEEEIFSMFAGELTEDEISEVKAQKDNMELDQIKEKLFALLGKKKAKFSQSSGQERNKYINLDEIELPKPKKTGKSYDELFEKYSE